MTGSKPKKIFAISGSTRANSANESIIRFIGERFKDRIELTFFNEIPELPHFNPDVTDDRVVPAVAGLRRQIEESDGVIICTPEYVFSPPGALKNALEWTVSTTVFSDKPLALIVASGLGEKTFESLTLIMNTLGAKINSDARLLIQGARSKISQGQLSDETVIRDLDKVMNSFLSSIERK